MKDIKYKKEDIQKALQLINSLNINGVHNASSIVQVFNILNNPIIEKEGE